MPLVEPTKRDRNGLAGKRARSLIPKTRKITKKSDFEKAIAPVGSAVKDAVYEIWTGKRRRHR